MNPSVSNLIEATSGVWAYLYDLGMNIGFFALIFFILVFVHELGHFLMARLVGIRVERFSIGMGPSLFSIQRGDTEYRIGAIPLGGYVKMSGDDPTKEYSEEERRVGFLTQKPGAKLLVVFGGPVFNLILPIFIYALMLAWGIPTIDNTIGSIEAGPALEVGLRSGDQIVAFDSQPINQWTQIEERVRDSAGKNLAVKILRRNLESGQLEEFEVNLTPSLGEAKNRFGEDVQVGRLGISPSYVVPQIFFESEQSPIAKAGFQNFDRIVGVNNVPIKTQAEWEIILKDLSKSDKFQLQVTRSNGESFEAEVVPNQGVETLANRLGLFSLDLVIGRVEPDSPAAKAGLQESDRLISIGGNMLSDWKQIPEIISQSEGKPIEVVWSRGGEKISADMAAEKTTIKDPILGKDNPLAVNEIYRIGISPRIEMENSMFDEQSYNPIAWLKKGVTQTWEFSSMTVTAIGKLITGQLSFKLLGSPIMIYKVTGNTFRMAGGGQRGWIAFLSLLALLSISLGLVNLLPIPVLDGGHAVFFIIEAIRGKPLSVRVMELATQVGLILLVAMFALVIYNDIDRYQFFKKLTDLFR